MVEEKKSQMSNEFPDSPQSKGYASMGDVDLNVSVLTFGFWPPYPVFDVNMPPLVDELKDILFCYYI